MILIAFGGNLPSRVGPPARTFSGAIEVLDSLGVRVVRLSPFYRTAPVPVSDQPDFINAVAVVETGLDADALLSVLHDVEARFGRERRAVNGARTLDLDLLDYNGEIRDGGGLALPHPRLSERAFVLVPLRDIAPGWRHPRSGATVDALLGGVPAEQRIAPVRSPA